MSAAAPTQDEDGPVDPLAGDPDLRPPSLQPAKHRGVHRRRLLRAADHVAAAAAELLSLTSGQPQQLAPWPGLVALSAGNGAEEIYGQSSDGIFQRLGNGWSPQLKGPVDPSFPG